MPGEDRFGVTTNRLEVGPEQRLRGMEQRLPDRRRAAGEPEERPEPRPAETLDVDFLPFHVRRQSG
jgi:hypothetical protein